MAIGSGIGSQLGIATETTFNTPVTVSTFYEFTNESINYNKNISVGLGLRAGGQVARSGRRVVTTSDATGDINLDLPTKGLGLLLSYAMGGTVQTSGTYTLGDVYGRSFTAQVGVPQYGGTVTPKTIAGCKVSSWEISAAQSAIATGRFTIDGTSFTTATSLATASFPSNNSVFHFAQGAITVDGSSVANIKDFTLSVDNVLKTDRFNLGSAGIKAEQIINGFRAITGSITAEFTDTTLLAKFLADTSAALVLTFTGPSSSVLSITLPAVKFDGEAPQVGGPEVIDINFTFQAYDNGTDQPLTIVYTPVA
jgi:Phage tail tube protein